MELDYNATTKKDRIKYLKSIKALAQKFLLENKEASNKRLLKWQRAVVNNNLIQLKKCIREIKNELHPNAIERFIFEEEAYRKGIGHTDFQLSLTFFPNHFRISTMWMEIARYSFKYSIINDMYWVDDGTVKDHFEVVMGIKKEGIFEQYCDDYIDFILYNIIPYFKDLKQYSQVVYLLVDLAQNFNSISCLSSNILMHSIIESIVRSFCTDIISFQNSEITFDEAQSKVNNYSSLENLINNGDWRNIRPIEFGEALLLNNYINDDILKKAANIQEEQNEIQKQLQIYCIELQRLFKESKAIDQEIIVENSQKIMEEMKLLAGKMVDRKSFKVNISLRVDLQFLVRRYKENRNSMVHGNFENFNYKWYCYVNLSSIKKLFKVIMEYRNLKKCDFEINNY